MRRIYNGRLEYTALYRETVRDVQDAGIGVAQKDVSHMFERFYRSDAARSSQTGGSGLGLSIAKWIVDQHGGYFEVVSAEGIGTRVSIHLPQKTETQTSASVRSA